MVLGVQTSISNNIISNSNSKSKSIDTVNKPSLTKRHTTHLVNNANSRLYKIEENKSALTNQIKILEGQKNSIIISNNESNEAGFTKPSFLHNPDRKLQILNTQFIERQNLNA